VAIGPLYIHTEAIISGVCRSSVHHLRTTKSDKVHTREGMPRPELVVPRGRPLLRPCWGRVRLPLLPEHVTYSGSSARTMTVLPATSFPSPCAIGAQETSLAASPVSHRRASAIPPRGRPVRLRPAWPTCPRPHSRGSPCGPGTSISRSLWQVPACVGSLSLASPGWRRSDLVRVHLCVIRLIAACASVKIRSLPSLCRLARPAATARARAIAAHSAS